MSPENRATVHDERLGAAFQQGLAEGIATSGDEEEFHVICFFEGVVLKDASFPTDGVPVMFRYVSEHLSSAVGTSVTIERRLKPIEAISGPSEADDNEVVDAEIVEDGH